MSYNFNSIPTVPPTGSVAPYVGTTDPPGWAICDGVSRSNALGQYDNLINAGLINQNSYTSAMSLHIDNTTSILSSGWTLIGLSGDGNTIVLNGKYLSTNATLSYSILFTPYNTIPTAFNCTTCSISNNGKTIIMNGYQSTTQGATWTTNLCSKFSAISSNGNTILMDSGTSTYLLLSTNGGTTYNQISGLSSGMYSTNGLPTTVTATIYGVCMSSNASVMAATFGITYQLYLSVNSGNTWTQVSTMTNSTYLTISGDGNVIGYRNGVTINISTNQGYTWPLAGILNPNPAVNGQFAISSDGTKVFTSFSYFTTTNSGKNWISYYFFQNNGYTQNPSGFSITPAGCAATPSFSVIYGSVGSGANGGSLFVSDDLGKNWQMTGNYNQDYLYSFTNWFPPNGFGMSDDGSAIVIGINYTGNGGSGIQNLVIYISTNGGLNFKKALLSNTNNVGTSYCNAISGNGKVFFLNGNLRGGNISTDSGKTYRNTGFYTGSYTVISYTGHIISNGPYTSTDMGTTWNTYTAHTVLSMSSDGTMMIAANTTTVFLSSDYGKNWIPISGTTSTNSSNGLPIVSLSTIRVSISGTGTTMAISANNDNVYLSNNSGVSWVALSGPAGTVPTLPNTTKLWSAIGMSNDAKKIIVCNTLWYLSTDSGITFTNVNSNSPLYSGAEQLSPANFYMSGDGNKFLIQSGREGLYISNDGFLWYNILYNPNNAIGFPQPIILNSGIYNWQSYSLSENGNYALAGTNGSVLFVSYDSEKSFLGAASNGNLRNAKNWKGTAISSSGQFMLAVASAEYVYYSNNFGYLWYQLSGLTGGINQYFSTTGLPTTTSSWNICAMDGTGGFMLTGINSGSLYLSTNSGTNWLTISGAANSNGLPTEASEWSTCAISTNGTYMLAGINSGSLYLSSNSGTNWLTIGGVANSFGLPTAASAWSTVSINSTGTSMIAGINLGSLFLSTNSGNNWSTISGISNTSGLPTTTSAWRCSKMNSSGNIIYAGINPGLLYSSVDGGKSWVSTGPFLATSGKWQTIGMNGSGRAVTAAEFGGYVYNIDPKATYTPPQINSITNNDATLNFIIKY